MKKINDYYYLITTSATLPGLSWVLGLTLLLTIKIFGLVVNSLFRDLYFSHFSKGGHIIKRTTNLISDLVKES